MATEEKTLEIIIASNKVFDLSKLNTGSHTVSNSIAGEARKRLLECIKSNQEFKTSTDLIIRLNNSKSLNNSVISEAAYAEIYFSSRNEDEFSQEDLDKAIDDFYKRKRNFGA
jgi:undecaprenyl diphosphate synthase